MQKIKKIIDLVLQYGILAWMAVAVVWYLIVSTLHRGISCDEGYYLMGYLRGQNVEGMATDFHHITRALCRPFADDNIMVFRWMRLVLNVLALVAFALSSYKWLSKKKGLCVSRWFYYPMAALAGAMSFTFAAPTLSYDSIEVITALFAASMLFAFLTTEKEILKSACAIGFGFLMWFAVANYPPAGVCLVVLFAIVFCIESEGKKWKSVWLALLGLVVALVVYHFFVHDLRSWLSETTKAFVSAFTEKSKSGHDSGNLVTGMLKTVGKQLVIMVPTAALFTLVYRKIRVPAWLRWGFVIVVCGLLLIVRKEYYMLYGTLLLFPVALMLAKVLSVPNSRIGESLLTKDMLVALVLVAIPLAGVFGTNQSIMVKAVIFTPFWLVAYFLLQAKYNDNGATGLNLVFLTMLFAGYVYMGNFQRYHYYYTPRSSKVELVGALRPQRVLVSQYQQDYYRDLLDTLRTAGCKEGDSYMAFGENQMAVYLAGGYIDGRLPYHWWQYVVFEKEPPKAFILFKNEEEDVIGHFSKAGWDFPEAYRRMEMRTMSENMGEELRTVIYVRNR